jgi:hypothetical protein
MGNEPFFSRPYGTQVFLPIFPSHKLLGYCQSSLAGLLKPLLRDKQEFPSSGPAFELPVRFGGFP